MAHMFKNRLQNYAQKRNLLLPVYSYELEGPPHARRFKAKVTFDGNTYEAPEYFATIKESEHAAAKVAFQLLSPDDVQEDGLYKCLLQELAPKKGFHFPTYDTVVSGQSHNPTFASTVKIGDESFQGQEAKTKKQAEMNAAKVAYASLTEGGAKMNNTAVSSGCQMMGAFEVSSSSMESTGTNELQPNPMPSTDEAQLSIGARVILSSEKQQADKDKGRAKENHTALSCGGDNIALKVSSSSLQSDVTDKLQPNVTPNVTDEMQLNGRPKNLLIEEAADRDKVPNINAKRHRCTSPDDGPSRTLGYSNNPAMEFGIAVKAGPNILVCPQKPNMTYPDGAIVASDDKWVALRIGMDQDR